MEDPSWDVGSAHFAEARRVARAKATEDRRALSRASLRSLSDARSGFIEHAAGVYASGATAADLDADRLHEIAEDLAAALEKLEPAFERLDVARDIAVGRGQACGVTRSRYDRARLTVLAAEMLAEETLSGPAGAVLIAAARHCAG